MRISSSQEKLTIQLGDIPGGDVFRFSNQHYIVSPDKNSSQNIWVTCLESGKQSALCKDLPVIHKPEAIVTVEGFKRFNLEQD